MSLKDTSLFGVILTLLLTLGVGEMWADDGDFYNMYIAYSFEGASGAIDGADNNTGVTVDAGTLTSGSLTLTGVYLKCWDDWGSNYKSSGGQLCYTNKGGSTQYISCTRSGKSGNNYEYQNSNPGVTLASYNQASGSFEFHCWGQTWGWGDRYFPKSSGHYVLKYKIAPPAVSGFTITPSGEGYVSGTGTESDPYIMKHDAGNLVLTMSGSKAHTDANSSAKYYNGSSWSTTATKTIYYANGSTTKQSVTLKMKYNNSTASLDGAVSEKTVYYQRESTNTVSASASPAIGGSVTPSSSTTTGQKSGIAISASNNTGYTFSGWSIVSGSGSFVSSTSTASNRFKPTSNTSLRATFTAKNYTVTLNKNGGDSNGSVQTTYNSSSTSSFTGASRAGYSCDGYFTDPSTGSKVINADGTLVSETVSGWLSSGNWVKDAATITLYAHWTEDITNYTVTYAVKSDQTSLGSLSCAKTVGGAAVSSGSIVASGTGVTFTASPITGYEVDAWCSNPACTTPIAGAGYANTYATSVTADLGVYVKFKKKIYTITYSPSSAPTGCTYTTKPTTGTYGNTVTMVITPSTGYTVSVSARDASSNVVTISNPSANTYTFTQPASAVTVTVSTSQIMSALSTSCHYDAGNPSYAVPTKSASSIGISTTANLSATAPSTGYTFVGWTLTHCVRTSGEANSRNITVRSDGSGEAATAVANYEEDLTTNWYIAGATGTNYPFTGWGTSGTRMNKKSGHSTEEIYYCNITVNRVASGNEYEFQTYNHANTTYYGYNNKDIDKGHNSTTVYSGNPNNMRFKPYVTGTYEFKLDNTGANPVLTVTWPVFNQVRISAASPTDATNTGNFDLSAPVSNVRTVTRSLKANTTYTFKIMYNSDWYGYNSGTFTRNSSTSSNSRTISTSGGDMTLTTDYAGDYTFKFNQSTKAFSVDFPTAYKVTYGKGTVDGSSGSCSAKDIDNGNAAVTSNSTWVKSGNRVVLTAPVAKTGYTYNGWFDNNSGTGAAITTNANCTITVSSALTRYACYTINNHTITHSASTHGSYTIQVGSAAAVSTNTTSDYGKTITLAASPATGYHFDSWTAYKTETPATTVTVTSNRFTMPDYAVTVGATFLINTYTIAFNANDENYVGTATGTTASIAATYGESYTLTSNGFSRTGYTFAGWNSEPNGSGIEYSNEQTGVNNLTAENGATVTLYAQWTGNTYTVSFNKGAGSCATSSSTVTFGSLYSDGTGLSGSLPSVTPPSGCVFSGWYDAPTGGTKIDESSVVTTASDHTLYARYAQRDRVYFYNNLGWSDVYVTYDAYWDDANGTGNSGKIYHHMTQIGSSNIWYDDIPNSVLEDWKYFIAFNSKQLGSIGESSNWGNFDSGEAVYRHDFDSYATMFVPKNGDKWKKNGDKCTYQSSSWTYDAAGGGHGENYRHTTGYWVRYNDTKSGYAITGSWDSWANSSAIQAKHAGDDTYIVTKTLEANTTYDFLLYKDYSINTFNHIFTYTTAAITNGNCTDLSFTTNDAKYSELDSHHTQITTTTAGEYVFKLTPGTDGVLKISVEYPFAVNDYRVTYAWNDGSAHSHSSEIIKAATGTNDTISVFVHKAANVTAQSLKIEKCTAISGAGVPTWTAKNTITLSSEDITANGVYNFIITQPASGEPTGAFWKKYDGKYYIRTECSDGGWNYYKDYADNIMTYSDYSMTQTLSDPYSHYYCRYIENTGMDITYQIATDYSPCVSEIFEGDATIGVGNKTLPTGNPASIRFSWNEQTNAMRRAYLKSAQGAGNSRYLVMHGADNKIRNNDATGTEIAASGDLAANELQFIDNGNWVYQVSLKAIPGAQVSLIAKYNGADRYLVGNGTDKWLTIMGGEGANKYEIAAVYDFKTNRLMTAWTPSGDIVDELSDVDLMLIRHAQDAATPITFGLGGSLDAKKVIGALRMDYNELFGRVASWTPSSRPLLKFFVSFPFDVYVSDVFGLNSAYGDAYVIQRYAGDERAKKGFFRGDGTTSFWTDLTTADTLHANVGYCVILDNDYFNGDLGSVWQNKSAGSSVYLYFPSAKDVGDIESTEKTITIPPHECKIDRPFGDGKNHTNTDSHWNMMGVPIFNDHTGVSTSGTPGAIFVTTGDQEKDCHYFYEWSSSNNQFSIRAALGYVFKSMHSYMVQYTGDVTFTGSAIPSSVAPRKQQSQSYTIELNVLNSNDDMLNRTYVELREEACDTFALNEDVYMSTNTNAVNIYTFSGKYEVAANVLSISNHTIPVGVEVRTAGTYTISMPGSFNGTATLLDKETGIRTNLAISDYEVALPKGVINERFAIEISDISNVITDIEYTNGEGSLKDGKAHKYIRNGLLYIVRDGKVYDARGAKVE